MLTQFRSWRRKAARAAAVVLIGWTCVSPPGTSAQLGSVVVRITGPSDGSTVSDTVAIAADVTIVGALIVAGVQFQIDGGNLGAEDTMAPYSISWNTIEAGNGSHSLKAVARDVLGIRWTSDPVAVTVSNDTAPPTVSITAPANGATVKGTVTIEASAADNVAVAGVQFFIDGAPLGAEDATAPYAVAWDTNAAIDDSHTLTARARDAAGNRATAAPVAVTVANAPVSSAATRFESTDPSITYTSGTPDAGRPPDWWHGSRSRDWSGRTASVNRSNGARATFTFTGTGVSWIGFRAPWAGVARVFVDGAFVSEVDLYAPAEQVQAPVFAASGLAAGTHTIAVESTGRKHGGDQCAPPDCASDYSVWVDAFDVTPAVPLPVTGMRVEETSDSVSFTGAWTQGDRSQAWSGGTAASASGGARAAVSFVGTSVSWIGLRGPETGIARIYLDGAFQALIDTFSPTEIETVVYSASNLAPARHVLTVEATGSRNAAATDTRLVVDAFDVQSRIEDGDPAIAYAGAWIKENAARDWSGTTANAGTGTAALSATAGSRAEFTFTGTAVSWIGFRSPLAGIATVWVDGASAGQVDLYAPAEAVQVPVFVADGLAPGRHTLRIDVTGQKNAAATNAFVVIDAFDVTLPDSLPAVTRLQEDDPSLTYTSSADWPAGNRYRFFSGEFARSSAIVGARVTLSFTGTGVRWIGQRRPVPSMPTGIARIYLDGMFAGLVDTRASLQEEDQAALFTAVDLSPGAHTVTIEVAGRSGEPPGATAEPVMVDAFDVMR